MVKKTGFSQSSTVTTYDGKPCAGIQISTSSDSNEIAVAQSIRKLMAQKTANTDFQFRVYADMTKFMKASIQEVYHSILISVLCVIAVVFLFLATFRSVIIPIVTIPICLIAAMGVMFVFGFSINMITLIALVLCIGLVVDDDCGFGEYLSPCSGWLATK